MRKKFCFAAAALLCLAAIVGGCNMFVTRGSIQTHTSTKWGMSYSYLNGSTSIKIELKQTVSVKVTLTHKSGSLTLTVKDADGVEKLRLDESEAVGEKAIELEGANIPSM